MELDHPQEYWQNFLHQSHNFLNSVPMNTKTQDHDEDQGLCRYKPRPIAAGTALSAIFVVKQKKVEKICRKKKFLSSNNRCLFHLFFSCVAVELSGEELPWDCKDNQIQLVTETEPNARKFSKSEYVGTCSVGQIK